MKVLELFAGSRSFSRPNYPGDYVRSVVPKKLCEEIVKSIYEGLKEEKTWTRNV